MKYFKITDITTNTSYYISSTLPNETPAHLAISLHLDPEKKYNIEEVSYQEFFEETKKVFED